MDSVNYNDMIPRCFQGDFNESDNANTDTDINNSYIGNQTTVGNEVNVFYLDENDSQWQNGLSSRNDLEDELSKNWQRLKYDNGYYQKYLEQSTKPLNFILDPINVHRCQPCRPEEIGYLGKFGVSYNTNKLLIDTESELLNLTRPASKDPNFQYFPHCLKDSQENRYSNNRSCQVNMFHFPSSGLRRESTRLTNPTFTMRETGINRFQSTYLDHQDPTKWEIQGEVGINYRLVAKDNHVPCIPKLIDQTPALPTPQPVECQPTTVACANNIAPLHNLLRPWN